MTFLQIDKTRNCSLSLVSSTFCAKSSFFAFNLRKAGFALVAAKARLSGANPFLEVLGGVRERARSILHDAGEHHLLVVLELLGD